MLCNGTSGVRTSYTRWWHGCRIRLYLLIQNISHLTVLPYLYYAVDGSTTSSSSTTGTTWAGTTGTTVPVVRSVPCTEPCSSPTNSPLYYGSTTRYVLQYPGKVCLRPQTLKLQLGIIFNSCALFIQGFLSTLLFIDPPSEIKKQHDKTIGLLGYSYCCLIGNSFCTTLWQN